MELTLYYRCRWRSSTEANRYGRLADRVLEWASARAAQRLGKLALQGQEAASIVFGRHCGGVTLLAECQFPVLIMR